jgi:hypothetical protein
MRATNDANPRENIIAVSTASTLEGRTENRWYRSLRFVNAGVVLGRTAGAMTGRVGRVGIIVVGARGSQHLMCTPVYTGASAVESVIHAYEISAELTGIIVAQNCARIHD